MSCTGYKMLHSKKTKQQQQQQQQTNKTKPKQNKTVTNAIY